MGRMKEQQSEYYLSSKTEFMNGGDSQLVHPTFLGLLDIVKHFTAPNSSPFNFELHEALSHETENNENELNENEKVDPNQLFLFNAEAI